jgi:hypothetical protein
LYTEEKGIRMMNSFLSDANYGGVFLFLFFFILAIAVFLFAIRFFSKQERMPVGHHMEIDHPLGEEDEDSSLENEGEDEEHWVSDRDE